MSCCLRMRPSRASSLCKAVMVMCIVLLARKDECYNTQEIPRLYVAARGDVKVSVPAPDAHKGRPYMSNAPHPSPGGSSPMGKGGDSPDVGMPLVGVRREACPERRAYQVLSKSP